MNFNFLDIRLGEKLIISVFLLIICGCSENEEIFKELSADNEPNDELVDAVHDRYRIYPYPKADNTIYLNPPPLLVPYEGDDKDVAIEFELSADSLFKEKTYSSGPQFRYFYNLHQKLKAGTWYWRFRKMDGNQIGKWSTVYHFNIDGKEPVFVTPEYTEFEKRLPVGHPRIYCFLENDLQGVVPVTSLHPDYKDLVGRAKNAMNYELNAVDPYSDIVDAGQHFSISLFTAYKTLNDKQYYDKLLSSARCFAVHAYSGKEQICKMNAFSAASAMDVLSRLYDVCYKDLTSDERSALEEVIASTVKQRYTHFIGGIESNIFDNHTWQSVLCAMTQAALAVYEERPEVLEALEYFYELWTARAPATGFNRDGGWINGDSYYAINFVTLSYMPMLFSYVTGTDFLKHPWYLNCGKSLVYNWLPDTEATSFGDGIIDWNYPPATRAAFADFIAREVHDSYAVWYAQQLSDEMKNDRNLRLYRIARSKTPYGVNAIHPDDFENFIWQQDIGNGVAFSDMGRPDNNLALAFRSSPFGSASHTHADQNAFKLFYKGEEVYNSVGSYRGGNAHSLLQYRHTRGHNTILVNNIGQPYHTYAYGHICRGLNGDNLAYFLGDASHAYYGISDYWDEAIKDAGFAQTPEYGFGETPLNNYKRHIFMLRPNKIVIYDDLSADEAATWQWLLHSPTKFHLENDRIKNYYNYTGKGMFASEVRVYGSSVPVITQTNEWFANAEPQVEIPKSWHLTAEFASCTALKILTIIQVTDIGNPENVSRSDDMFIVGDWKIHAALGADEQPGIAISNVKTGTVFGYRKEVVLPGGTLYQRENMNSSVLCDSVKGDFQVQEVSNIPLGITRAAR